MPDIPLMTRILLFDRISAQDVIYRVEPLFGNTNDSSIHIPKDHFRNAGGPYPDKMVMTVDPRFDAIWNKP